MLSLVVMKPITNILLIGALICYIFLPFHIMELTGSITGIAYTAGTIADNLSLGNTLYALLPFIACFGAITFNCMKHRYWGVVAGVLILTGIAFLACVDTPTYVPLTHEPDVMPIDPQEGQKIVGMGIGYYLAFALLGLSLVSCVISMLPFKFNTVLEHSIDDTIERGISASKKNLSRMGHEIHDEWVHLEHKRGNKHSTAEHKEAPSTEPMKKVEENHAAYMPPETDTPNTPGASPDADSTGNEAYMPKGDYNV